MTTSRNGSTAGTAAGRRSAAVATAMAAVVLLAGCVQQSEESAERFTAELAESPVVGDSWVTTLTPFPFTVHAYINLVLEPDADRAGIDALRELSCEHDPDLSQISIDLDYELDGGALATQTGLGACWDDPASMIEALPALKSHAAQLHTVEWSEADFSNAGERHVVRSIDIELSDAGVAGGFDTTVEIVVDLIAEIDDDRELGISSGLLEIEDGTGFAEARMVVDAAVDLSTRFSVDRVTYDEGLFVELANEGADVEVRDFLAEEYPDLPVDGVVDSSVDVSYGAPSGRVLEAESLVRRSGLARFVVVNDQELGIYTPTTAAGIAIRRLITVAGLDDVPASYTVLVDDRTTSSAEPASGVLLSVAHLSDVKLLDDAFAATGHLGVLNYDPEGVWVNLVDTYDHAAEWEVVLALQAVVASGALTATPGGITVNERVVR